MLPILDQKKVAFIGAGSMAEGMISGMVRAKKIPNQNICVTNRRNTERLAELEHQYGIQGIAFDSMKTEDIDVFILAMKPKDAEIALAALKRRIQPHQIILSVLAGITTSFIQQSLHDRQPVVRVMPNTSSMIGESATAAAFGDHVSYGSAKTAVSLLECLGEVYVIKEDQMDIFTGIAGSGPAYFYYLMEFIEKAGEEAGLDKRLSRKIGAQTLLGAAKMLMETGEKPDVLRENITSPNGTTEAGLDALRSEGGGEAIAKAIKHATERSIEISKTIEKTAAL
ncbi:pyrroline-5-carboxylate reductase [Bacillus velezensis]|uniref:pyrroline-5-carboxylate reductase n=1 Tax=Bacillus TaxID=1386 RepID=UPI00083CD822|nr:MULTISPECIES: pyrroline-5-carboxylate reductase [Bacillus]ARJ75216.1 pyrroline-5-carboxylate reductase [Bacillus velezensis]AWK46361.1 pyrroline-5-carboxylate reductase [Bacillus velezensis]AZJ44435.1 pyrroline-5-carboxylate reductase [Bacillus velezensis]MCP1564026.1 pyrroline-5-carboxylate reductase [Bacillus velezensis]MCR4367249.1 pyrroline-5-carboxylate reductase [Bacillus amyloliquefaciens]